MEGINGVHDGFALGGTEKWKQTEADGLDQNGTLNTGCLDSIKDHPEGKMDFIKTDN